MNLENCRICPRNCGVDRIGGDTGVCGAGSMAVISRAQPHFWEEPCISGSKGSGTVFFSGCSLKCVYCQNYEISSRLTGKQVSSWELRDVFKRLEDMGVHNINLVNPTHFAAVISDALETPLSIPVVYNSGGYENIDTIRALSGKIAIYMPDFKYSDNELAMRYSGASDYFERAAEAILEMYRQTGDYQIDNEGIMKKGVLIRHLVLPGALANSKGVIKWVNEAFGGGRILFSLMSQYTPHGTAYKYPELKRRLSREEYDEIEQYLFTTQLEDGYLQDPDSAGEEYIPDFDLTDIDF